MRAVVTRSPWQRRDHAMTTAGSICELEISLPFIGKKAPISRRIQFTP
jgi:hypothetical protein